MKFLVFAASHRPESLNRKLAQVAARTLHDLDCSVDFAEYAEFDMPVYNDATPDAGIPASAWSLAERARHVSGILIASPEYNWSYPGSLKNILDWTSRLNGSPLEGKTAFLMSATPGGRGGILGLSHLKAPLEALGMFVFNRVFPLGHTHVTLTHAEGSQPMLTEPKQHSQLAAQLQAYVEFTRKMES